MDPVIVALGLAALLFGSYTGVLRFRGSSRLGRLQQWKDRFGAGSGTTLHVVWFTAAPILFGLLTIFLGLGGRFD